MVKQDLFFRCIAYKEKDGSFSGVCLDLDIVEEGHATLEEAILSINDAIIPLVNEFANFNLTNG